MANATPDWLARFPDPSKVRVAVYARRSKGKTTTYSPQEQVQACLAQVTQRGWRPRYVVVEDDARADFHRRPKWLVLLWRALHGKFDVLITWKTDRWARSLWDALRVERFLSKHGIAYVSVTEPFDTTTSYGRFMFRSLANFAELEREIIGERGSMARHNKAEQHRWPTRVPPLGYRTKPDLTLEVDSEEAKMVLRIFEDYRDEKNASAIAKRLRDEGRTTKHGKRYTEKEVYSILENRMYTGRWVQGGVDDEASELRIVPDSRFNGVQAIRKRRVFRREPMPINRKLEAYDRMAEQYFALLRESEIHERHEASLDDLRLTVQEPPTPDQIRRLLDKRNGDPKLRRLMAEVLTQ